MSKVTVYDIVTNRIIEGLKGGRVPWRKGWRNASIRPSNYDGREYSGINFFMAAIMPYAVPVYLTAKRIKELGGTIKDAEVKNGLPIVYWNFSEKKDPVTGNVTRIPFIRFSNAYNIEQCEGIELPERFKVPMVKHTNYEPAEAVIAGMPNPPKMTEGGDRACYSPVSDTLRVPNRGQFDNINDFYATMFHEMAHATGHTSRLNRKELLNLGDNHAYSSEELVAEMTAAFLCAETGVDGTVDNSVAYIAGWLKALNDDPKMVVSAAAKAQKAANYIMGRMVKVESED